MSFVISATINETCTELAHTRQIVATEEEAARIVTAHNSAEVRMNPVTGGIYRWGYYEQTQPQPDNEDAQELMREHPAFKKP